MRNIAHITKFVEPVTIEMKAEAEIEYCYPNDEFDILANHRSTPCLEE